ncbi:zf-HC2 domain-containing protein, partial [candidate division KSB1 bacterium]
FRDFKEICDYLGGDLDSEMCEEIKEHLENCPECGVYIDSIKRTVYLYQKNKEGYTIPNDCRKKILKNIKVAAKKLRSQSR